MASTVQDMRKIRMSKFRNLCIVTLPFAAYVFYALGGLYTLELDISGLKEQFLWCFMHSFLIYNDKSLPMVALGVLIWGVAAFSYYNKISYNLLHGKEYGEAKWGDIKEFNKKFADMDNPSNNKIFSENIRFKYDSSTLRNNNTFVVGGSVSGKTSFFLTPNLLKRS
ncbi:MAG: type IV secretion system protein VirD4 [Lachnospiraceae bacterium]|nr:type IV secretion system protein VirD4 [Lachnospiraceae bacterium]